jgi:hypothetical protein
MVKAVQTIVFVLTFLVTLSASGSELVHHRVFFYSVEIFLGSILLDIDPSLFVTPFHPPPIYFPLLVLTNKHIQTNQKIQNSQQLIFLCK